MRILIVDDDALVLQALGRMLRQHAVVSAQGVAEALFQIRAGHVFDAILCDIHMAGMDGRAFFNRLNELLPALASRVVFMAGSFCEGDDEEFFAKHPFLAKPFTAAAVERILEPLVRENCA